MKNLDLNYYGVQEMNAVEMKETDGGQMVSYYEYSWSGSNNSLVYTGEAIANGAKLIANAGIWVWNQFQ